MGSVIGGIAGSALNAKKYIHKDWGKGMILSLPEQDSSFVATVETSYPLRRTVDLLDDLPPDPLLLAGLRAIFVDQSTNAPTGQESKSLNPSALQTAVRNGALSESEALGLQTCLDNQPVIELVEGETEASEQEIEAPKE